MKPAVVIEQHGTAAELRTAVFSPDLAHRYVLQIVWDEAKPLLIGLCLNPSKATHLINDPTVARCCRRALMLGFGGFVMLNAFAFRATEPADMKRAADPVGPENDRVLREWFFAAATRPGWAVMVGWGIHGAFRDRHLRVAELAQQSGMPLQCLGVTAGGQPRHPLYIGYDKPLIAWP